MRAVAALALAALLLAPSCRRGQKPDVPPAPWGTTVARTGVGYAYSATATDLDGDSVAIRFDWDDGSVSGWSDYSPPGDTVTTDHIWPRTDTCHIRAQARDRQGNVSAWSYVLRVGVTDSASNAPSAPQRPVAPDTCWMGILYAFRAASVDPDNDSITYEFDWGDSTSTVTAPAAPGDTVKTTHAWSDSGLHLLRVRARDPYRAKSAWTEACSVRIRPEGTVKWCVEGVGNQYSCPAIAADGTIYVSSDEALSAVDPEGHVLWQDVCRRAAPPAIGAGGLAYFGARPTTSGYVLRSLGPDGSRRWDYRVSDDILYAPAIGADGTIYFAHDAETLYALNPDSTLKWGADIDNRPRAPPAVGADGAVYIASSDSLFCFEPDGTVRWRRRHRASANQALAIAADGTVYFTHPLTAYGPQGDTLWKTADSGRWPPAVGADGTLYIPNSGQLACRGPDGSFRWQVAVGSGLLTTPALASDGTIYVHGGGRYLYAFRGDGSLRWGSLLPRYADDGLVTIGADGTVYVCGEDELIAVVGSAPLANSPWPKYQHDLSNSGRAGGP